MLRAAAGEAAVQVLHGHQSALLAGLAIVWPDGDKDRGPEVFFDTAGFGEGHDLGFFGVSLSAAHPSPGKDLQASPAQDQMADSKVT